MMPGDVGLRETVRSYLSAHHSMTLATASEGEPWAASVFYVHDDKFRFYFLSDRNSRHIRELEGNGAVAAAVNEDPGDWRGIKGVQLEGRAFRVPSPVEKAKALALYLGKFPFVKDFFTSPLEAITHMSIAGKAISFDVYRLAPKRLYYLDNEAGFSHRVELALELVDTKSGLSYTPGNVD